MACLVISKRPCQPTVKVWRFFSPRPFRVDVWSFHCHHSKNQSGKTSKIKRVCVCASRVSAGDESEHSKFTAFDLSLCDRGIADNAAVHVDRTLCVFNCGCVWGHVCIRLLISGHSLQGDRSRDYNKAFSFRFYKAATSTRALTHDSHAHSSLHHCHHTTLIVFRSKNKSPEKLPVADSHQWSRYQQSHCDRSLVCMFQRWRHSKEYFITERDNNIISCRPDGEFTHLRTLVYVVVFFA